MCEVSLVVCHLYISFIEPVTECTFVTRAFCLVGSRIS